MSQMEPEIEAFVEAERRRNFGTAKSYGDRLRNMDSFSKTKYENMAGLLKALKNNPDSIYTVLDQFAAYLQTNNTLSFY